MSLVKCNKYWFSPKNIGSYKKLIFFCCKLRLPHEYSYINYICPITGRKCKENIYYCNKVSLSKQNST